MARRGSSRLRVGLAVGLVGALLTVAACGGDEPKRPAPAQPGVDPADVDGVAITGHAVGAVGHEQQPLARGQFRHARPAGRGGRLARCPDGRDPDLERRLDLGRPRAVARGVGLRPPRPASRTGRGPERPGPARAVSPTDVGGHSARPPRVPGVALATEHQRVVADVRPHRGAALRRPDRGVPDLERAEPSSVLRRHTTAAR